MTMGLVWSPRDKHSWFGYSGELIIGMAGQRSDGSYFWKIEGVHVRDIDVKASGEAKSEDGAKLAADNAWKKWIEAAGLERKQA